MYLYNNGVPLWGPFSNTRSVNVVTAPRRGRADSRAHPTTSSRALLNVCPVLTHPPSCCSMRFALFLRCHGQWSKKALSPKGPVFNSQETPFAQELLQLMNELKPRVPPTPPLTPIIPTKLRKILRERVDIFGKHDQQVQQYLLQRKNYCISKIQQSFCSSKIKILAIVPCLPATGRGYLRAFPHAILDHFHIVNRRLYMARGSVVPCE